MCARFRPALELPDNDEAMFDMVNQAGAQAIQTDETKAAENLLDGEQLRELLLVAKTILEGKDGGM